MTARIPKPGWYEPEQGIVSRYVQAAASGEYPDVLTATRRVRGTQQMIIDTAMVVASGSPCLTAHRCLASAARLLPRGQAPVRQCVHRPSLSVHRSRCGAGFIRDEEPRTRNGGAVEKVLTSS
jgi:hypothetical protein